MNRVACFAGLTLEADHRAPRVHTVSGAGFFSSRFSQVHCCHSAIGSTTPKCGIGTSTLVDRPLAAACACRGLNAPTSDGRTDRSRPHFPNTADLQCNDFAIEAAGGIRDHGPGRLSEKASWLCGIRWLEPATIATAVPLTKIVVHIVHVLHPRIMDASPLHE